MELFAPPVERLIEEFAKLPGIGQKTAQRLAFHVLDLPKEDAERFADAIREAKAKTFTCKRCQNLTDSEICPICSDKTRNQKVICVVAEPRDVIAFERTKEYKGLYHVLHGTLSPMGHVGPDDIRIRELVKRRGRSHGDVHFAAAAAVRHQDYAAGVWYSGWRAFGVRR